MSARDAEQPRRSACALIQLSAAPQGDVAALRARLGALLRNVEGALATARRGQLLSRGLQAWLLGLCS